MKKILHASILVSIFLFFFSCSDNDIDTNTYPEADSEVNNPISKGYKVLSISDGDTFYMLDSLNAKIKIRMHGIDAPEKGQDFYQESTQYLYDRIADKMITYDFKGKDQYGRTLLVVYIDGENINQSMVREGYAWQYKYNKEKIYQDLQAEAKAAKRGLWMLPDPIDPWQFRKDKKNKS